VTPLRVLFSSSLVWDKKKKKDKVAVGPKRSTQPELILVSIAIEATESIQLLLPGWDASPSQGYPQQYVAGTHLYTWVEAKYLD